jgi:hypothetical protein
MSSLFANLVISSDHALIQNCKLTSQEINQTNMPVVEPISKLTRPTSPVVENEFMCVYLMKHKD